MVLGGALRRFSTLRRDVSFLDVPPPTGEVHGRADGRVSPVLGVLTGGITPRFSDLFSRSLDPKRFSKHFQSIKLPDFVGAP